MIPETTVFVISYDDQYILTIGSVEDIVDELYGMVLAEGYIGITGMFVVDAKRFDKRDAGQRAGLGGADEELFIEQVFGLGLGAIGEVGKISDSLMVKLEGRIGGAGKGAVPATGIPQAQETFFFPLSRSPIVGCV